MTTSNGCRPIKLLAAVEYFRDGRPWTTHRLVDPEWRDVESAIRRMDNFCFPIVQLQCTEDDADQDSFNLIGGDGRIALLHFMGDWRYTDERRGDAPVHLWESDQGYECQERHVVSDIDKVLRISKRFYETGSFADLDLVS